MISISQAFRDALTESHTIATKCELYSSGVYIRDLPIHDGNVTVDYGVPIRRRYDLRLTDVDGTLTPSTVNDLLAPVRSEIKLFKGIKAEFLGAAADELVPMGVFGLADVNVYDSGDGFMITVAGFDRSRRVSRAKLVNDYVVTAGTNFATAIRNLLDFRVAGLIYATSAATWASLTSEVTPSPPLVFFTGDDPWEKAIWMANVIGKDLFFDANGNVALETPVDPNLAAVPDWIYAEGVTATILNLQRRFSDEHTFNHIVVTGERTGGAPVRAEAKDTNVNSPTYYLGEYGDVVLFEQSSGIQTLAQGQSLADARLSRSLGIEESLAFTCIANPAHDVNDVLDVARAKSKITGRYQIDKITHPMIEERAMNISCRRRRI